MAKINRAILALCSLALCGVIFTTNASASVTEEVSILEQWLNGEISIEDESIYLATASRFCKKRANRSCARKNEVGSAAFKKCKRRRVKRCRNRQDPDGDNIRNKDDNCDDVANPEQEDSNGDGVGDACEDADNDGAADASDNCPNDVNPDQADADGDGVGDVCDNCSSTSNADQADADGDGTGNACEKVDTLLFDHDNDSDDTANLFYDVLSAENMANGIAGPDVIFDTATSMAYEVENGDISASLDLVVLANEGDGTGNDSRGHVTLFDDYLNLASPPAPDLVLNTGVSMIDEPVDAKFHGTTLWVLNCASATSMGNGPSILGFKNIAASVAGGVPVAPDVVITDGAGGRPVRCDGYREYLNFHDGDLYLALDTNPDDPMGGPYTDDEGVKIYRDIESKTTGDGPDVVLREGSSPPWFGEGPFGTVVFLLVTDDDKLFVTDYSPNIENDLSEGGIVWVFEGASTLTSSSVPDYFFGNDPDAAVSGLGAPRPIAQVGGRIWVGNGEDGVQGGIAGFNGSGGGIAPDVYIGFPNDNEDDNGENNIRLSGGEPIFPMITVVGLEGLPGANALIGLSSGYDDDEGSINAGIIYKDPANVGMQQPPDIFLVSPTLDDVRHIESRER